MNEGEHDKTDAFDFYDDVSVFFYSGYNAFISLEGAADYSDMLAFLEIFFGEYLAVGGVLGCEEAQETYGFR